MQAENVTEEISTPNNGAHESVLEDSTSETEVVIFDQHINERQNIGTPVTYIY